MTIFTEAAGKEYLRVVNACVRAIDQHCIEICAAIRTFGVVDEGGYGMCLVCPACFVPVEIIETGRKGAGDGEEAAYA